MKKRTTILKLIVSAAFIAFISIKVDWGLFIQMLGGINPLYFILCLIISPLMILESCFKWQMMLRVQGVRVPFLYLLKNYYIGYFFTVMLPSNVGGDVVRSYYVGKRVGDQYTSAVAVFIERFSGILFLLLLAVITPFFQPRLLHEWPIFIPMIGSAFFILLFIATVANERLLNLMNRMTLGIFNLIRHISKILHLGILTKLIDKTAGVYVKLFEKGMVFHRKLNNSFTCFRAKPVYIFWIVFLSILFYIMTWFNVLFAFMAFNVAPDFMDVVSLLPIIMLVSMIPITLGSIGLAEGAYVFYFLYAGIAKESSFIMSLLLRSKLILIAIIGFLLYLTYSRRKEEYKEMVAVDTKEESTL